MSARTRPISKAEFASAFSGEAGAPYPPILTAPQAAKLLQISVKTLYFWAKQGRLDGSFRRRGKPLLFWRDRLLDNVFNSEEWS